MSCTQNHSCVKRVSTRPDPPVPQIHTNPQIFEHFLGVKLSFSRFALTTAQVFMSLIIWPTRALPTNLETSTWTPLPPQAPLPRTVSVLTLPSAGHDVLAGAVPFAFKS